MYSMHKCQASQSRCGEVAATAEGLLQTKGDFPLPRSQWASHPDPPQLPGPAIPY